MVTQLGPVIGGILIKIYPAWSMEWRVIPV